MATVELKSKCAASTILPCQLSSYLSLGVVPPGSYASCQTSVTDSDPADCSVCIEHCIGGNSAEVVAKRTSGRLALKATAAAAPVAAASQNPVNKQTSRKHIKLHTSSLHNTSQQPHANTVLGFSAAKCSTDIGGCPTALQAPVDCRQVAADTSPAVLCLGKLGGDSATGSAVAQATGSTADEASAQAAQLPQSKLKVAKAKETSNKLYKKRKRADQATDAGEAAGTMADQTAQGSSKVPQAKTVPNEKKVSKEQPNKCAKAEAAAPPIPDIELDREYTHEPGRKCGFLTCPETQCYTTCNHILCFKNAENI